VPHYPPRREREESGAGVKDILWKKVPKNA